jgi:hypothetical protein
MLRVKAEEILHDPLAARDLLEFVAVLSKR